MMYVDGKVIGHVYPFPEISVYVFICFSSMMDFFPFSFCVMDELPFARSDLQINFLFYEDRFSKSSSFAQ